MQRSSGKLRRFALTIAVGLAVGAIAPQAAGARPQTAASCHRACDDVRFSILKGFDDPATPDDLDRVGVLEVGPERARNVLVLSPGTSAGAGYFKPLADDIVRRAHGRWQVCCGVAFPCLARSSRGRRRRSSSSTTTSAGSPTR